MLLLRIRNRIINLDLMRYAYITPEADKIHIYFTAEGDNHDSANTFDVETFTGRDAEVLIEYMNSHAAVLLWPETTDERERAAMKHGFEPVPGPDEDIPF